MTTDMTREDLLHDLRKSHKQVDALLKAVVAIQDWQPEPAEWSFRYIAAHLATVELDCFLPRIVQIASGTNPHLDYYVNTGHDFARRDLLDSLDRWAETRQQVVDFVQVLPEEKLTLTGTHDTFGVITILDAVAEMAAHDHRHARHIQQLISDYHEQMAQLSGVGSIEQYSLPA